MSLWAKKLGTRSATIRARLQVGKRMSLWAKRESVGGQMLRQGLPSCECCEERWRVADVSSAGQQLFALLASSYLAVAGPTWSAHLHPRG